MNLAELQRKLIAAARGQAPDTKVPYAFEKRILARLRSAPALDFWGQWAAALWRAAAPCIAFTILLSAWSFFSPPAPPPSDLTQDFENTILAAVDQEQSLDLAR